VKSAREIIPTCSHHRLLRAYDLREIDSPEPRGLFRLKYLARLRRVVGAARRRAGAGGLVLEVGCSQANAGLLLAEAGLTVVALDLLLAALTYARAKYEQGRFLPVVGSAEALPVRSAQFDCVILGELLEHCAHPRAILAEARRALRPGGCLVLTTPNGQYRGSRMPLYRATLEADRELNQRQFGPEGAHHLFAFTRESLLELVRAAGLRPVQFAYLGSALFSDRLAIVKRLLPPGALLALAAALNRLPGWGRHFGLTLFVLAEKTGP